MKAIISSLIRCAALVAFALSIHHAKAAVTGPYTADANTLHLWHLDELTAPAANSGLTSLPLAALQGGATLGNPGYGGFGMALNTAEADPSGADRNAILAALTPVNGVGDSSPWTFAHATSGAFTYEGLLRVDFNPSLNYGPTAGGGTGRNSAFQLITGENDGGTVERSFQLRLSPIGFDPDGAGTLPVNSSLFLELVRVPAAGAVQYIQAPIPTAGPDAIAQGNWYHFAVAYDGVENTADNIKVYWTLLDPSRTAANQILSANLAADLNATAVDFAIGNEARATGGETDAYQGLIDEVRISDSPRAAGDFVFAVPEPSTYALVGLGCATMLLLARRRRR
jgi:hypothetical protein